MTQTELDANKVRKKPIKKLMAVSAYARLRGVNRKTMVLKLANIGWRGKVDVQKVDELIAASSSSFVNPGKVPGVSMAEALRRDRLAKARMQELKLQKIEGTLVDRAAVEKKMFDIIRRSRDALLNIPARISGILAAESDQAAVFRILTEEIQAALEGLST